MSPVAETLLGIARQLLSLATERRGSKEFGVMLKEFDRIYKRASNLDQSDYHRSWAAEMLA